MSTTSPPEPVTPAPAHGRVETLRVLAVVGERIIAAAPALLPVAEIDSGYPDGLAGDAIPLAARIVAVCDAYETMTSDRVSTTPASPRRWRAPS